MTSWAVVAHQQVLAEVVEQVDVVAGQRRGHAGAHLADEHVVAQALGGAHVVQVAGPAHGDALPGFDGRRQMTAGAGAAGTVLLGTVATPVAGAGHKAARSPICESGNVGLGSSFMGNPFCRGSLRTCHEACMSGRWQAHDGVTAPGATDVRSARASASNAVDSRHGVFKHGHRSKRHRQQPPSPDLSRPQ
jgi:hypothetical protein